MSSILKALKKLEHEKAARRPDSFRIDAEILRGGASRSFFSTGTSLAAVALFLCGMGATYLFMKYDKTPASVQSSQAPKSEVRGEPPPGSTLLPVPTIPATEPQPRPSATPIASTEKSVPSPRSIAKQQQTPRARAAEIVPQAVPPEPKAVSPSVTLVAPAVAPAKPVLKVYGIAFQDGAEGVAVVNGVTLSKGSLIEGVRVEEIQKDRVRFSRGGEKFDIILDKSN